MSYGKYTKSYVKKITTFAGKTKLLTIPGGYSGLFWGTVYCNGVEIKNAQDYFYKMAKEDDELEFDYWTQIIDAIEDHCRQYVFPYVKDHENYHYQCGFGGDECDGLIDFWLPEAIPVMPDLSFEIQEKTYKLKWTYSSGE